MPITRFHTFVGAVTGATFYAVDSSAAGKEIDPEALLASFVAGGLAGSLPDILEPPLHRSHRGFFHSVTTLCSALYTFGRIDSIDELDENAKRILKSSLAAYLSHLLLDSRTPVGLPVIF